MPKYPCTFVLIPGALACVVVGCPDARATCPGPSVDATVRAALTHAGLAEPRAAGWRRGLGWAALLPRLTARVSRTAGRSEYWSLGPRVPDQDMNSRLALHWELRATWDLSRLLFDGREISVSRRASQLSGERERLVQRVIELYYERCHLLDIRQPKISRKQAPPAADAVWGDKMEVRLQVVTALLRTLTGQPPETATHGVTGR